MVIRATIEHMKTRPHQERRDFAALVSFVVVGVLFVGWLVLFVRNVSNDIARSGTSSASTTQTGNAQAALDQISQQMSDVQRSYSQLTNQVAQPAAPQIINVDTVPDVQ